MDTNESRFLELMKENKGILLKISKIYQEDADDRNDLFQEMVLQLWLAFSSYRGESKFSTWMYRVALNTALVFFKKSKKRPKYEPIQNHFEIAEEISPSTEKEEQLAILYKAIQKLEKVEKALIYLYMEDLPYSEIALNMGISEGNLRVRINRIKNKLKDLTKKMNDEY